MTPERLVATLAANVTMSQENQQVLLLEIQAVIDEERERCAKILESHGNDWDVNIEDIAWEIRNSNA